MTSLKDRLCWLLATCFGLGYCPVMPGTAGALVGVAIYVAIAVVAPDWLQIWLIAAALLLSCAVTVWLNPWAERYFKTEDSSNFVTDEVAGFLFTVLLFVALPLPRQPDVLLTVLWAFPATRVIDIIKVPPARRLERLPGGWGVLADDLLSSVYAAALLHAVAAWRPAWFGLA